MLSNIAPHKAYTKEEAVLSVEHAKKIIDFIKDEIEHFKEIMKEKNEKKKKGEKEKNGKGQ